MPQQTLNDETVVAEATDGTLLILDEKLPSEVDEETGAVRMRLDLADVDRTPGRVRFVYDDEEPGPAYNDMEFDEFRDARLAFGLWLQCGPFHQPESGRSVPVEVATDGQDAVTAYVYLGNGFPLTREAVASKCGVAKQTVSDRLTRVRWTPGE